MENILKTKTMTDFSKALVRCSAIGYIMQPPRGCITEKQLQRLAELENKPKLTDKQLQELADLVLKNDETAKEPLSEAAKTYLLEVYAFVRYGRKFKDKSDFVKQIRKGTSVEEDSFTLISVLDRKLYKKNDQRINNEFFTGEPDYYEGEDIRQAEWIEDTKSSWDLETFLPQITAEVDPIYYAQMQGYFDLTGAKEGGVSFCLVNTPESQINDERKRLFYQMDVATELNPKYLAAVAEVEHRMKFDDIPMNERRHRFIIQRDDAFIEKAKRKVERCRRWLEEYHEIHMGILGIKNEKANTAIL
jgi:hypothetical protein